MPTVDHPRTQPRHPGLLRVWKGVPPSSRIFWCDKATGAEAVQEGRTIHAAAPGRRVITLPTDGKVTIGEAVRAGLAISSGRRRATRAEVQALLAVMRAAEGKGEIRRGDTRPFAERWKTPPSLAVLRAAASDVASQIPRTERRLHTRLVELREKLGREDSWGERRLVFIAYRPNGRACCWSESGAVAARSARKVKGFVRSYLITAWRDGERPLEHEIMAHWHVDPPMRWAIPRKRPARAGARRTPTGSKRVRRGPEHAHPRGGTTDVQSVLLPKDRFPTKGAAAEWLRSQKKPFKANRIDDSGKERPGKFWRARQFNPTPFRKHRIIPFGASGIKAVIEIHGRRRG